MAGFDIRGIESSVSVLTDIKQYVDYTRFDIIGTSCYQVLDSIQHFIHWCQGQIRFYLIPPKPEIIETRTNMFLL